MIIRPRKNRNKEQKEKRYLKKAHAELIKERPLRVKTNVTSVFDSFGISGVYYLYKLGHIVYIGESACVMSRIGTHVKQGVKDFDSYTYEEVAGGEKGRKYREKHLIKRHNPVFNKTHAYSIK